MKKKTLVPLDGSQLAEQVLPYATALANNTDTDLLLLSVVVPVETWLESGGLPDDKTRLEAEIDAASDYLKAVKERTWNQGPEVLTRVVVGRPASAIRTAAADERAEFIAMTTHGRSGLPRLVVGSIASEIVRTSGLPVLLVRAVKEDAAPTAVHFKRILLPVDGSPGSVAVVRLAAELAKRFAAEVIVQRVMTSPAMAFDVGILSISQSAIDQIETESKDYVARFANKLSEQGIATRQDLRMAYPASGILDAAKEYSADLIVMGTHSRTGLGWWVLGSTANHVVAHTDVPCLLVRPPEREVADAPLPNASVEIIPGVSVARTVPVPPDLVTHELPRQARPTKPQTIAHPPERRKL